MTLRELYVAIANQSAITTEMIDKANEQIAVLNLKSAKSSSTPSKASIANQPLIAEVEKLMRGGQSFTAKALVDHSVGHPVLNVIGNSSKATAILKGVPSVKVRDSINDGRVVKEYYL